MNCGICNINNVNLIPLAHLLLAKRSDILAPSLFIAPCPLAIVLIILMLKMI